ncbi:hypothetical protein HPB50_016115 [Hyalomma asiaticum]|uniref:Uncharacterized protein n=1 Tax=Hyalomma asiaticum TaxID=266040 RepID=A0ACB7SWP3_HYAAI|nr:hypothetical protein HPB50_016115 [Hyalomma asiaticum]
MRHTVPGLPQADKKRNDMNPSQRKVARVQIAVSVPTLLSSLRHLLSFGLLLPVRDEKNRQCGRENTDEAVTQGEDEEEGHNMARKAEGRERSERSTSARNNGGRERDDCESATGKTVQRLATRTGYVTRTETKESSEKRVTPCSHENEEPCRVAPFATALQCRLNKEEDGTPRIAGAQMARN